MPNPKIRGSPIQINPLIDATLVNIVCQEDDIHRKQFHGADVKYGSILDILELDLLMECLECVETVSVRSLGSKFAVPI
jgi:hypothetical protein